MGLLHRSVRPATAMTPNRKLTASDKSFLEAFRRNEQVAFRQLYDQYKAKIAATVRYVLGPCDDLEDVIQNVFFEIFRSVPRYKGESQLSTWMYRIAVNVSMQHIRKLKRTRQRETSTSEVAMDRRSKVDPLGRLEDREILRKLYQILSTVGTKKRTVYILYELNGLPVEQIAEIVGCPTNTVKSRLFHARREVMKKLKLAKIID